MLANASHTETLSESVFAAIQGHEQIEDKGRRDCRLNEFITLSKNWAKACLCICLCVFLTVSTSCKYILYIYNVADLNIFSLVLFLQPIYRAVEGNLGRRRCKINGHHGQFGFISPDRERVAPCSVKGGQRSEVSSDACLVSF